MLTLRTMRTGKQSARATSWLLASVLPPTLALRERVAWRELFVLAVAWARYGTVTTVTEMKSRWRNNDACRAVTMLRSDRCGM